MLSSYLVADHIVPLGAYTDGDKYFETFLKIYRSNSVEVREGFLMIPISALNLALNI
jgi:hypothetical protein